MVTATPRLPDRSQWHPSADTDLSAGEVGPSIAQQVGEDLQEAPHRRQPGLA